MVQTEQLKREILEKGLTDGQVAWHLGMSEQCFARRLQSGRFGTQDMQMLTELLELECPQNIFFA